MAQDEKERQIQLLRREEGAFHQDHGPFHHHHRVGEEIGSFVRAVEAVAAAVAAVEIDSGVEDDRSPVLAEVAFHHRLHLQEEEACRQSLCWVVAVALDSQDNRSPWLKII